MLLERIIQLFIIFINILEEKELQVNKEVISFSRKGGRRNLRKSYSIWGKIT